ncbi:2-hydroxyacid dehydrogenase [Tatumella sp. UBA2305]|uniref:2-hydroxyacid dehydrogenase n=1 Tax=Tatumella sp. UBA2305 TaxID=1947647 RepID=UPI0025F36AA2|nr:glyoxylate/hydroxypyruvate reductase A [Tatumella sp. UBA2305]
MKIICQFGDDTELARLWVEYLQHALPGSTVSVWERGIAAADFAIVWKPSAELFEQQSGLKAVFNAGAGVDAFRHINLSGNVPVFRLEDAGMAEQMSDYVCQAVLHHFREMDSYAFQAATQVWKNLAPRSKDDFPVGILGFGIMGKAVAHSLSKLGFRVNAWARSTQVQQGVTCYAGDRQLKDFLAASRIVVCLLPLTPATRGILCTENFSYMPQGSYIINVGRGGHLQEDDLLAALESGHIAGATLDVFQQEPLPADHPFWQHPKVVVTPHIAAATLIEYSVAQIADKITALQAGLPVSGQLDPVRGY